MVDAATAAPPPAARVVGSVVVPAHDEASVLGATLGDALSGFAEGELEVVVVCNGCSDDTADVARRSAPGAAVLERGEASKAAALRAGDCAATAFPRVYLDADVRVPGASLRAVLDELSRPAGPLAARPRSRVETGHSSSSVRSFYRARARLGGPETALWGAGVYAVRAEARGRFGAFPDLVADDLFVDQQFAAAEKAVLEVEPAVVTAPATAADLLAVLRRVYSGNRDDGLPRRPQSGRTAVSLLTTSLQDPSAAADGLVYLVLVCLARASLRVRRPRRWERDSSSRRVTGELGRA